MQGAPRDVFFCFLYVGEITAADAKPREGAKLFIKYRYFSLHPNGDQLFCSLQPVVVTTSLVFQ